MARLELDKLTKVYDDSQGTEVAVEELDLDIADGEFVVIVGPSGCGKSTTLRMLAGLETVSDGEIRIDGEVINDLEPRNRDIAMVFQSYALYPHKSVRGNMGYGLKLSTDLSEEEIDRRVEETAEMMGIEDLLDKRPGSLSGGQKQRVATGRAIVREPSVFLFDEPLSNLDAKLRKHMRTELARLHSELGITSIYVTHDQEEAMTMADRIVILEDGELQQVGPPKVIYHNPNNLFVADFVGSPSMNFLDVDLEDGTLVTEGVEYRLSADLASRIRDHSTTSFTLGIRPEKVRIVEAGATNAIPCEVDVVETVGSDNFLYLDIAGREFRVRSDATVEPDEGETVYVTFDEDDVHLFDRETTDAVVTGGEPMTVEPS